MFEYGLLSSMNSQRHQGVAIIAAAVATAWAAITLWPAEWQREDERLANLRLPASSSYDDRAISFLPDPSMRSEGEIPQEGTYTNALENLFGAEHEVIVRRRVLARSKSHLALRGAEVEAATLRVAQLREKTAWWGGRSKLERAIAALRRAERRRNVARNEVAAAASEVARAESAARSLDGPVLAARNVRDAATPEPLRDAMYRGLLVQRDTIVVMFDDDASGAEIEELLQTYELTERSRIERTKLYVVETVSAEETPEVWERLAVRLRAIVELLNREVIVESAVQNGLLAGHIVPKPRREAAQDPQFSWFAANGNVPLVKSRFPEAWNFNDTIAREGSIPVAVGILDEGFNPPCKDPKDASCDLVLHDASPCGSSEISHGTQMASIIGAKFDNGIGVDGANPFARIYVCSPVKKTIDSSQNTVQEADIVLNSAPFAAFIASLEALLVQSSPEKISVINASIGYRWRDRKNPPQSNANVQAFVARQGIDVRKVMNGSTTVLVTSAGNDRIPAIWGSPFNWAALAPADQVYSPAGNIIVVEGLQQDNMTRLPKSNVDGMIQAIGVGLHTLRGHYANGDPAYETTGPGTSNAAPLVAATVALMRARYPNIAAADIKAALCITGSGTPKLDAFTALRNAFKATASRDLADLDPGGALNSSDAERFKSAYQQVNGINGTALTNDLNEDGIPDANDVKFCRADFDGNGKLEKIDFNVACAAWPDGMLCRKFYDNLDN